MHDWVLNNKNPGKVECVWSPSLTMTVWIKAMRLYYSWSRMAWADSLQLRGVGAALVAQCILEMWGLAASEDHVQ